MGTDVHGLWLFLGNVRISLTPTQHQLILTSFLSHVHVCIQVFHLGIFLLQQLGEYESGITELHQDIAPTPPAAPC